MRLMLIDDDPRYRTLLRHHISCAWPDVERAWRDFDSGTALEASEDLVHTGPTGTNVGDILIGLKHSAGALRGDPLPRML